MASPRAGAASGASEWLGEGWVRDHHEGMLHRVTGEAHRGPDGVSGWSERKLANYLREHQNGDPSRAAALRKAKTRRHLLELAEEWGVPYVTEAEWEALPHGDDTWHQRPAVGRDPSRALPSRVVILARMALVRAHLSEDHLEGWRERLWDRGEEGEATGEGWHDGAGGLKIRPCRAPTNVRMLVAPGDVEEDDDIAVLEVAVGKRLVEVRQLHQIVASAWGLRCHRQRLALRPDGEVAGGAAANVLFPEERLQDVALRCAQRQVDGLVLELEEETSDEGVELRILALAMDSSAESDAHRVHTLLWSYPASEGSAHQLVVAAEADCAYGLLGGDGGADIGVERVYALIDTTTGGVLSSFVHAKPGVSISHSTPPGRLEPPHLASPFPCAGPPTRRPRRLRGAGSKIPDAERRAGRRTGPHSAIIRGRASFTHLTAHQRR